MTMRGGRVAVEEGSLRGWLQPDRVQDVAPRFRTFVLRVGFTGERTKTHGTTRVRDFEATPVPDEFYGLSCIGLAQSSGPKLMMICGARHMRCLSPSPLWGGARGGGPQRQC